MSLSIADVHRIAHLARIRIDAQEAEEVRAKLDAIFALINAVVQTETAAVQDPESFVGLNRIIDGRPQGIFSY